MIERKRLLPDRPMTAQELRARWVANNPEKALEVNRKARAKRKAIVDAYKAERGCEDCGNSDPRVLDLHHRQADQKVESVNVMRVRASLAAVMSEAAKCDVLCANCHRIRHAIEVEGRKAADTKGSDMSHIQMTTGVFFRAS